MRKDRERRSNCHSKNRPTSRTGRPVTCLVSFLEGIITFISLRLLPMLPIYLAYFAGGERLDNGAAKS